MSYDLTSQGDDRYSIKVARNVVYEAIAQLADVEPNGTSGFVLKRGKTVYMEIDVELVSEEGDNIEDLQNPAPEVNCINFHIPYAFVDPIEAYLKVALEISDSLGWKLYDLQTDQQVTELSERKPWRRFC
jgi:hypothetical protein